MLSLILASLFSWAIVAQDFVLNEDCHPEDVRSERITTNPEGYISYYDELNKLQFDTTNAKNSVQMSYLMDQKVTFSKVLSGGAGVLNHVMIFEGIMLRVVTITGSNPVVSLSMELFSAGAGITCHDAVIFNNDVYVVCLKGVTTVADELYYIVKYGLSPPQNRIVVSFAPTSGTTMLLKDQIAIRAGWLQADNEGAVLFNSIPVNLAKDKGINDQVSTKFAYLVDIKGSLAGTAKFKSILLTSLQDEASSTTLFACNFISDMLINLLAPANSRLYVLAQLAATPTKLTIFSFIIKLDSTGWIIDKYTKRLDSTGPALTSPIYAAFSQNTMTIRVISARNSYIADWTIDSSTGTITDLQQAVSTYRSLDFPSRVDECFKSDTDAKRKVCTNIYDEKIDNNAFTVFELIFVRRDTPIEVQQDRIFRSYKSHGVFYYDADKVKAVTTGRSNYEWFILDDPTPTEQKQNNVVIFFSRFAKGTQVSVAGKMLPAKTAAIDKPFKFTSKDMLVDPVVPTFDSKINWYLKKYVRLIMDTSLIKGNGLTYSFEGSPAGIDGIVFKDNLVGFQYIGTQRPAAASNFYLFGSNLFILPKSGDTGLFAYDCSPFMNASLKTVQMNCSLVTGQSTLKSVNTLTNYQKFTSGYYHMLFKETETLRTLVSYKGNKLNTLLISDPIVDALFASRVVSNVVTYYLCTLQKVASGFLVKVYTIDDDGVKITSVADSDPAVTKFNNPTMIVRCQPETAVVLLDFRLGDSTPVLVTVKFDANKKLVLDKARDFWRPNMQANANMKACLFDNNRLLYWYTGTIIAGVIPEIERNAYELYSLGLTELGFKDIKQIDCNFTSNTFVVFGTHNSGNMFAAAYDVAKMKDLVNRLILYSDLGTAVQSYTSFFDNDAWYFSGSTQPIGTLQATDFGRIYNNSAPIVYLRDTGDVPREVTAMLTVKNLKSSKSITIKINTKVLSTSFISEVKNGNNLQALSSFNVDSLVALTSHVMAAEVIGRTAEDTALVKLTPRIVYYRTVEDSPVRRILESRSDRWPALQSLGTSMLSQTQKPSFAKQMIVKDKLTIALFDTDSETRVFLYDNTEKFEKSFDDLDQFCSAFDFILSEPSTVHLFIFCSDKKLRMSKEKLNTTTIILDAGAATATWNTNYLRIASDSSFEKFFITYYDSTTKATTILATKVLMSAVTGNPLTLVSKENIANGSLESSSQPLQCARFRRVE